jgi:uncharacterized protein (TIGR00251 family)
MNQKQYSTNVLLAVINGEAESKLDKLDVLSDVKKYIINNHLKILVKPNSVKTEILKWDDEKKALRVNVHAKPEDNEANIEVVKFFSKLLKKKVVIKSGLRSREKLLLIE